MLLARAALAIVAAHVLPGILLVRLLGLGKSSMERAVMGAVLGGPLGGALYWVALVSKWPTSYWILLGLIDLAALYSLGRRHAVPAEGSIPWKTLRLLLLLLAGLEVTYLFTTGVFFRLDRAGNFLLDPAFTEDTLFHVALVEGLQHSYPPELFSVSGVEARYHLGYHLQVAAWTRFFAVDPYDGVYRVGAAWSLGLLVLSTYLVGVRFSACPSIALVASALVFGGGLGFFFHAAPAADWWSLVFMDATLVSIFLVNPLLPALPLFFICLVCLDDYFREGSPGALTGSALATASLFTVKELLGAQALAGFGLAALLAEGASAFRARRAAAALGLASMPLLFLVLLAAARSNTTVAWRPLEIVRYSMETLGRKEWVRALAAVGDGRIDFTSLRLAAGATALWVPGFLGLRLAGARGVLRDAASRSGSLRHGLALFVLIGFPLTLLLRIAPAEATGLTRQEALNDAFWFATLSGCVMWLWTAEALVHLGRRSRTTRALVMTAAVVLAFPATVQHFVHHASLPAEFIPPPVVEAARASRALSAPGEVFLEPLRRVRPSVPAYLAGRPVVYESYVGYNYQFVRRADLDFRHHAVALFWSTSDPGYVTWFLSNFRVGWIYVPREAVLPRAAETWTEKAFENDAVTLYRVAKHLPPDFRVIPPGKLPLGASGDGFFGEDWGRPESSPRSRRLRPGGAALYVPLPEGDSITFSLTVETPHAPGRLALGRGRAPVDADQKTATLTLPEGEAHRGLNRLELRWDGEGPLRVTSIELTPTRE